MKKTIFRTVCFICIFAILNTFVGCTPKPDMVTDEDIIERLNQQSEGVKLKLAMTQNDKQVVKLAEDVDINKPIVALESLIHEKFAHQLIDIENETNEIVSIHIQNDKMYLSMASFCDIFLMLRPSRSAIKLRNPR